MLGWENVNPRRREEEHSATARHPDGHEARRQQNEHHILVLFLDCPGISTRVLSLHKLTMPFSFLGIVSLDTVLHMDAVAVTLFTGSSCSHFKAHSVVCVQTPVSRGSYLRCNNNRRKSEWRCMLRKPLYLPNSKPHGCLGYNQN
jgi:hypothetical protein